MQVVHAREPFPDPAVGGSIFLAGPTPRADDVPSWRPEALDVLAGLGFGGAVFVPEPPDGRRSADYDGQIGWELEGLDRADAVAFWVPRRQPSMPAFTTNVEFGYLVRSGRALLGFPEGAEKSRYLAALAGRHGVPVHGTLRALLADAAGRARAAPERSGGERTVPGPLFSQASLLAWLTAKQGAGHRLDDAEALLAYPSGGDPWLWALRPEFSVAGESRTKGGEVVVGRPDSSAVVAWHRREGAAAGATRVVLVREFRSAAAASDGCAHGLPGGSADGDPADVALTEMEEETGIVVGRWRLVPHGARQVDATLLAHRVHLFSVELDLVELQKAAADVAVHGDGEERTTVEVATVDRIRGSAMVDWATLGMIEEVVAAVVG